MNIENSFHENAIEILLLWHILRTFQEKKKNWIFKFSVFFTFFSFFWSFFDRFSYLSYLNHWKIVATLSIRHYIGIIVSKQEETKHHAMTKWFIYWLAIPANLISLPNETAKDKKQYRYFLGNLFFI